MLRRILLVLGAVAAIAALAGAGIVVAGNKVVITPNNAPSSGQWVLGAVHGPQPGATGGATITISSPKPSGGPSPDIGLQGGPISCVAQEFSVKVNSDTIGGQEYTNCSDQVTESVTMYADYFSPLLWGCTWQQKSTMGNCNYTGQFFTIWCPYNGTFNAWGIPSGQLWRTRSHITVYFPGIGSGSGDTWAQVQF